jgi:hypothetical protein
MDKSRVRVFLCLIACLFSCAQVQAEEALSPTTLESDFQAGLESAQNGDWKTAIGHFEQARVSAPYSPSVFLNLGICESMIPGRELRAACWLQAYLAAAPSSANAADVKQQIVELKGRAVSRERVLADALGDLAMGLPSNLNWGDSGGISLLAIRLANAAIFEIKVGNAKSAVQIGGRLLEMQDQGSNGAPCVWVSRELVQHGFLNGAMAFAGKIHEGRDHNQSYAYADIAEYEIGVGNTRAAVEAAERLVLMQANEGSSPKCAEVSGRFAENGNLKEALALASKILEDKGHCRSYAYIDIAEEQAKLGLLDDANASIGLVDPGAWAQDPFHGVSALVMLADIAAKAGKAELTASMIDRATNLAFSYTFGGSSGIEESLQYPVFRFYLEREDWRHAVSLTQLPAVANAAPADRMALLTGMIGEAMQKIFKGCIEKGDVAAAEEVVDVQPYWRFKADDYAFLVESCPSARNDQTVIRIGQKLVSMRDGAQSPRMQFFIDSDLDRVFLAAGSWSKASNARSAAIGLLAKALSDAEGDSAEPRLGTAQDVCTEFKLICHRAVMAMDTASAALAVRSVDGLSNDLPGPISQELVVGAYDAGLGLCAVLPTDDVVAFSLFTKAHPPGDDYEWPFDLLHRGVVAAYYRGDLQASAALLSIEPDSIRSDIASGRAEKASHAAAALGDYSEAKVLASSDGLSDEQKKQAMRNLAIAEARQGLFDDAEALAGGDPDIAIEIARQRSSYGDRIYAAKLWDSHLNLLAATQDAADRKAWVWSLNDRAAELPQLRNVAPLVAGQLQSPAEEANRNHDEPDGLSDWPTRWDTVKTAKAAGLYTLERRIRLEFLDQLWSRTQDDYYLGGLEHDFYLGGLEHDGMDLSAAEFLELRRSVRARYMTAGAARCLAAAGDRERAYFLLKGDQSYDNLVHALCSAEEMPEGDEAVDAGAYDDAWLALAQASLPDASSVRAIIQSHYFQQDKRGEVALLLVKELLAEKRLDEAKEAAMALEPGIPAVDDARNQILVQIAERGAIPWAEETSQKWTTGDKGRSAAIKFLLDCLRLRQGDLSTGSEAFWAALVAADDGRQGLILNSAQGGAAAWAAQWTKAVNAVSFGAEPIGPDAAVESYVRSGDLAAARQLIEATKRFDLRVEAGVVFADTLVKIGKTTEARKAYSEALGRVLGKGKDFNPEDYAAFLFAKSVASNGDYGSASASAIADPKWRSRALSEIAEAAAGKDKAATLSVLDRIPDSLERSAASNKAIGLALEDGHPDWALEYLGRITDLGLMADSLGDMLNYGIDRCDIASVMPAILSLPPGEEKAWLLADALRAHAQLGVALDLHVAVEAGKASLYAMPQGYYRARLATDWARLVAPFDLDAGKQLTAIAVDSAKALSGDDSSRWATFITELRTARTSPDPAVLDAWTAAARENQRQAASDAQAKPEPNESIDRWINILGDDKRLSNPLFLDFDGQVATITKAADANKFSAPINFFDELNRAVGVYDSSVYSMRDAADSMK